MHNIKIWVVAALFLMPAIASAKTTLVNEYKGNSIKFSGGDVVCPKGTYEAKPNNKNAFCQSQKVSNNGKSKTCWKCYCNTKTYEFTATQCSNTGFKAAGTECYVKNSSGAIVDHRYTTCGCASGYQPASDFVDNGVISYAGVTATNTGSNGTVLTCKSSAAGDWGCTSGTKLAANNVTIVSGSGTNVKLKSKSDASHIIYNAISNKTANASDAIYCTRSLSFSEPLYASIPAKDCAEYSMGTAKHYPNTSYYYFNGACSNTGKCVTTVRDCAETGQTTVATWNGSSAGSVTCKYVTGCSEGVVTQNGSTYLCSQTSVAGVEGKTMFTDIAVGNVTCRKHTGCATGYDRVHIGSAVTTNYSQDESNNLSYDVGTVNVTAAGGAKYQMTCRMANGCRTDKGYYNFACNGGCWEGYLSYWLPR